jgi:Kef-type K+ transport system membrane component KefB
VLIVFFALAILIALIPRRFMNANVMAVIERGHHTSSQTAVRIVVLLLVALLALANSFSLDIVLGAFAAGIIVRFYVPKGAEAPVEKKLEAIAFGVFIPIFFVATGVKLDVHSIIEHPERLLLFFVLLAVVRGLPQLLVYRRAIPNFFERSELSLFIATALPIIVAVTAVQVDDGIMRPENAAALVGAGALSVVVFPLAAQALSKLGASRSSAQDADSVEGNTSGDSRVE